MISPSEKKLVLLRLETMPEDIEVSIGPWGTFSKEELIKHVKKEDDVGEFIIQMQLVPEKYEVIFKLVNKYRIFLVHPKDVIDR